VLEPEGETHHIGKHTIIQVKLPGVKEEDIDIRKLEESIEIKAFKNDTAYFKQVQVSQSSQILSHHLEGDELIIEVG
jgi:HSP20 family molecular chaperone IbpA